MQSRLRSAIDHPLVPGLLAGQLVSALAFARSLPPDADELPSLLVAGLLAGAWIAFGGWSLRRLRAREARVYKLGVLAFGFPVGITGAVMNAADAVGGLGGVLGAPFLQQLVFQLAIGFPLWIWGGSLWGRLMTATFGGHDTGAAGR